MNPPTTKRPIGPATIVAAFLLQTAATSQHTANILSEHTAKILPKSEAAQALACGLTPHKSSIQIPTGPAALVAATSHHPQGSPCA
jgi:hypothetical protein